MASRVVLMWGPEMAKGTSDNPTTSHNHIPTKWWIQPTLQQMKNIPVPPLITNSGTYFI